jgi:pentatricopeptide repeat protein
MWYFTLPTRKRPVERATNIVRELTTLAQNEKPMWLPESALEMLFSDVASKRTKKQYGAYKNMIWEQILLDTCLATNKRLNTNYYRITIDALNVLLEKKKRLSRYGEIYDFIWNDLVRDKKYGTVLPNIQSFLYTVQTPSDIEPILKILLDESHELFPTLSNDIDQVNRLFNHLISTLVNNNQVDEAISVFNLIRKSEKVQNLFDIASKPSKSTIFKKDKPKVPESTVPYEHLSVLKDVISKMVQVHGETVVRTSIHPSSISIHLLLKSLALQGKMKEAIWMYMFPFAESEYVKDSNRLVRGNRFHIIRLNVIIREYFSHGMHNYGNEIYTIMQSGDLHRFHRQFDDNTIQRIKPNLSTHSILLEIFATLGDEKRIQLIRQKLKPKTAREYQKLYLGLVKGYTSHGDMGKAIQVLEELKQKDIRVKSTMVNFIIQGFIDTGKLDESMQFLIDDSFWRNYTAKPNRTTFYIIMRGFSKQRVDVLKVVAILFFMYIRTFASYRSLARSHKIWPKIQIFKTVFETMAKAAPDANEFKRIRQMIIKLSKDDTHVYGQKPVIRELQIRSRVGAILADAWDFVEKEKKNGNSTVQILTNECMTAYYDQIRKAHRLQ